VAVEQLFAELVDRDLRAIAGERVPREFLLETLAPLLTA
jgi:hypothetical protein